MQQFREINRTRTIYSTETHTSDFILNTFWNGKPVQFFQERCWVVVTGCQENKSCSKVLNFLERFDDRIRCTHKETAAVVKPWKDVGSNKSLGCVFSEKPADWTNACFTRTNRAGATTGTTSSPSCLSLLAAVFRLWGALQPFIFLFGPTLPV